MCSTGPRPWNGPIRISDLKLKCATFHLKKSIHIKLMLINPCYKITLTSVHNFTFHEIYRVSKKVTNRILRVMMGDQNFGPLWVIHVFSDGLLHFRPFWATFGNFWPLWATSVVWANLDNFKPLFAIHVFLEGLSHFGLLWAT